jgi:hypothetical protein
MKPGIIYRGEFLNAQFGASNAPDEQLIIVSIYDTETLIGDSLSENIIALEMAENPVTISVIDNDEDKFKPIRSKQAEIIIHSSDTIEIATFATGGDNRYKVEIAVVNTSNIIFVGFLSLSDLQMEFQPDPNEITLVATDNLGALRDIPLAGSSNLYIRGKNPIGLYIAQALNKTGLSLEIWVVNNIREANHPTEHLYSSCWLDGKTFESEIGVAESCYSALEKILGENCFLTQWKGKWFIQNVDELDWGTITQARFNATGGLMEYKTATNFIKLVGEDLELSWIGAPDTPPIVTLERPYKESKGVFKYDPPIEIIDNINFSRGDWLSPIDLGTELDDDGNIIYYLRAYSLDDWTMTRNSGPVTAQAYIVRKFSDVNLTQEKEKFVRVLTANQQASPWDYLRCNPVPVHLKDKATVSVDFKLETALTSLAVQGRYIFTFYIAGTDGNVYAYDETGSRPKWTQFATITGTNFAVLYQWQSENFDEKEWQTVTVDLPAFPIDGDLYMGLYNGRTFDNNTLPMNYSNLRFEYIPYVNGDYSKYTGQYHKVSHLLNTKAVREAQVYISDSPKKIFKGALYTKNLSDQFVLANQFFEWASAPTPAPDQIRQYGYLQAFIVWNQFNRHNTKFEGTIDGLQSGNVDADGFPDLPDLLFKYILTDTDNTTNNRYFQLLHFEQNLHLCEMRVFLYEVFNTATGKKYNDAYEFKYISQ